jgi:septal ring factor EnvC (AmiA/AmiB activator)
MASTKKKSKSASKSAKKKLTPRKAMKAHAGFSLAALNYRSLESELNRLTDLLQHIRKKSTLVRRSLAYLEREQRRVTRQINDAKRFLNKLKNRGIAALRHLPENAEELFYQLKAEFNRFSKRLRA